MLGASAHFVASLFTLLLSILHSVGRRRTRI